MTKTEQKYFIAITNTGCAHTRDIEEIKGILLYHGNVFAEVYRVPKHDQAMSLLKYLVHSRMYGYTNFIPPKKFYVHGDVGFTHFPTELTNQWHSFPTYCNEANQLNTSQNYIANPSYLYANAYYPTELASDRSYLPNRVTATRYEQGYYDTLRSHQSCQNYTPSDTAPTAYPSDNSVISQSGFWSCTALNAFSICDELSSALFFLDNVEMLYPSIKWFPSDYMARLQCQHDYMCRHFITTCNPPHIIMEAKYNCIYINTAYEDQFAHSPDDSMLELLKAGFISKF